MALKLMSISSMKPRLLYILLPFIVLTSCSTRQTLVDKVFCFDSMMEVKLYEGSKDNLSDIKVIINKFDRLTDNYQSRGVENVYTINNTNDEVTIDPSLYDLLKKSFDFQTEGSNYFNPLCGGLAKKWKESLKNAQILDEITKNAEIQKINESSVTFKEDNNIQRSGEAEIDLGAVSKGYALDQIYTYLNNSGIKQYLINGGKSSILLGEKNTKDGLFYIKMDQEIAPNTYLKLKNCFVSTSATYAQGVEIDGVMYSHIVNPLDGNAVCKHDAVIVISDNGFLGDALSTSMMLHTIDEIKELETQYNVKALVYENKKPVYINEDVEVFH